MNTLLILHVLISLAGLLAGFFLAADFITNRARPFWTRTFLVTTIATSVTGFFFTFRGFTPAIGVGLISLIVLLVTLFALYGRKLAGPWRATYVVTALLALYLNCFVLIVQLFQKVPALHALAPTQSEPPFALSQALALVGFVVLAIFSVRRFHPSPSPV